LTMLSESAMKALAALRENGCHVSAAAGPPRARTAAPTISAIFITTSPKPRRHDAPPAPLGKGWESDVSERGKMAHPTRFERVTFAFGVGSGVISGCF